MKSLKYLLPVLFLGVLAAPVVAQDQTNPPAEGRQGKGKGRGPMMNADARVAQLDKALSLTADQKAQIKDIYTKAQQDMPVAGSAGSGDRKANREKMQQTMKATREQVRAVLTDEQKKKFDEMPQGPGQRGGKGKKKGSDA